MGEIKRIIFDNDGVNIDSEHVAMGDMAEFGFALVSKYVDPETAGLKEKDIYVDYKGQSSNAIIDALVQKYDLPVDAIREDYEVPEDADLGEFLSDLHTKSVIQKFENELFTLPGFARTIEAVRQKYGDDNIALCTTSRGDRMDATVHARCPETGENVGWGEIFSNENNLRLSGYGHANKYVYFRSLNPDWDPAETAIVEDTAGSTKKAINAGFENVIGIVASKFQILDDNNRYDPAKQFDEIMNLHEAGAKIVVTDYRDVPLAVEWIGNGMKYEHRPDFSGAVYIPGAGGNITYKLGPKI